jgi:heme/copper-type cytochrome/quinol oxidase subunit 2
MRQRNLSLWRGSGPYMKPTVGYSLIFLSFVILAVGCHKDSGPAHHIKVVMKKYTIEPSVIRVKAGETVALEVSTADVQHGLDIPDLGIKEPVQPGKPATVTFTPKIKGEYRITCGVICGPHHEDMVAKLVVE